MPKKPNKSTEPAHAEKADRYAALLQTSFVRQILSTYGENSLRIASEYPGVTQQPRISTGIFALDFALGGGFPTNANSILWGHKSTGKTVICLRTLANAQKTCARCYQQRDPETGVCGCGDCTEMLCAFLDVEGSWNEEWAQQQGVDTSRLLLSVPEFAEQALDIAEALLQTGDVDFLIIDSLAFLTPSKEIEESTGKALQAEQARVIGRAVRKLTAARNRRRNRGERPTILLTNQIRMKIGIMFGNPETQPGGMAPGFAASTEVRTFGGKYEMDELTGMPVYVDMNFRVEKNKVSRPRVEGQWRLMLSDTDFRKKGEVYEEPGMVEQAIRIGLVTKEGGGWQCLGQRYKSKTLLIESLVKDSVFKQAFGSALLDVLTVGG